MSVLMADFNKVNVVVKVNFTLEQATKAQMGVEVKLYSFFNFGARWGGRSNSRLNRFTPEKRSDTHCIGGCVGPRAGLDRSGIFRPPTAIRSPACNEALYRLSYPSILTQRE